MKYRKILTFLCGVALLVACDTKDKFHVEGSITGAEDETLYFEAITINGVQRMDSVRLDEDGEFSFSGDNPGSPEFYSLRIKDSRINLSIDSTETVSVKADYAKMVLGYDVEGSENCSKIKEIVVAQHALESKIVALEDNKSMYPGDIADSIKSIISAYKEKMKEDYIFKAPMSAYAYYAVSQSITDRYGHFLIFDPFSDRADVKCYATVATAWDGYYHDSPRTEQLCNMASKGMENTAPVGEAEIQVDESKISETGIIDVELPDVNGVFKKLTDLKGKVVMLDFTKLSEKGSDVRTRTLRSIYDKYSSQGFEIYQVSLDDDLSYWKFASENLPWVSVHETDGRSTSSYGVVNLPTYFLINRDNEIVLRSDVVKDITVEIERLL